MAAMEGRRRWPLLLWPAFARLLHRPPRPSFDGQAELGDSTESPFEVSDETLSRVIEAWRARSCYLPAELLWDPAWGMLLELFQAELQDRRVSKSRLFKMSAASATVAARWLKALECRGLAVRTTDLYHPDIEFVELSRRGSLALRRYFHEIVQAREVIQESAPS